MLKKIKESIESSSILLNKKPLSENNIRVAINGFGRIGRMYLKLALDNPNISVIAINDLGNIENMAYLLKYDSSYRESHDIETEIIEEVGKKYLLINSISKRFTQKKILFVQEKEIDNLP
ncbi:MAG: glyceraldehyde 3-phosphate dehydrogenase NAD-binding domain-containing protein [Cyanobium sp. MAG06]|nr:glyceraldehyde 3-phosphate dehydrogenase NAD-binding domain-containing protein [Cyanobium sp. MAG06]